MRSASSWATTTMLNEFDFIPGCYDSLWADDKNALTACQLMKYRYITFK
jgi:hypothetical protein